MLRTPMMTISQGNPTARTIAPPVDGPACLKSKKKKAQMTEKEQNLPFWFGGSVTVADSVAASEQGVERGW